jgi:dihydrofolate reductase
MRKVIAGFAASLDGYIEGPNGEYDWILIDKEIDFAAQMKRFDTFLYGRKTYEKVLPMTNKLTPGISNYVFSTTLTEVHKSFTLVKEDIKKAVTQIKEQEGKDIAVFGGASLLASLLNFQLVDELSVSIIPVLLGQGKPMVAVLNHKVGLSFIESKTYGNGTLHITYKVNKKRNSI